LLYRLTRYIAASIVGPIDDLVEVLDRMMQGDLMLDIKPRVRHCSAEIAELYQVFSKLKIVLRFGEESFFTGNEAEALMNFSQALKLFEEFENLTGMGICWNNIGNIHLKAGRYEEAVNCYSAALQIARELRHAQPE